MRRLVCRSCGGSRNRPRIVRDIDWKQVPCWSGFHSGDKSKGYVRARP